MMKKTFCGVFALLLMLAIPSCGGNDDEPQGGGQGGHATDKFTVSARTVFSHKLPKEIDDMKLFYNDKDQLEKVVEDYATVTFDYSNLSSKKVRMKCGEKYIIDMTLNNKGFVESCIQNYNDGDKETWKFNYNTDGQMTYIFRSEGNDEETQMTYSNGNLVKTYRPYDEPDNLETIITYSSTDNMGSIMFFDKIFGIDIDEMKYAYYAGLLGKATKQLPATSNGSKINWEINSEGYPTSMNGIKITW